MVFDRSLPISDKLFKSKFTLHIKELMTAKKNIHDSYFFQVIATIDKSGYNNVVQSVTHSTTIQGAHSQTAKGPKCTPSMKCPAALSVSLDHADYCIFL